MKEELKNPVFYIPRYFKVQTKPNAQGIASLVPMVLWPSQKFYIENRTHRDIVLKNRQTGMSTGILASNAHAFFTQKNERQSIITHDDETSTFLLATVRRFHSNLPSEVRPKKGYDAGHRLSLEDFDSYMYIDSAKSDSIGIGHGLTRAHLCLHPDSEVLLFDGTKKPISDVAVGDITISKKFGSPVEIKHIHTRFFSGKLCKLTFCGNASTPLICTPEHKILGSTDKEGWIEAKDVKWIGSPIRKIKTKIRNLPVITYTSGNERLHKKTGDIILNYEFGWLLGLYYAEGSFKSGGIIFSLSPKETGYRDRIKSFCDKFGWGTKSTIVDTHGFIADREINGHTMYVEVYSTSLKNIIKDIVGEDKIMPDWLWECPKEFLNGIIDGYIDGDGSYSQKDNYTYVTSVRPHLLYQLRELLLSVRHQYAGINYGETRGGWVLYFPMQSCKGSKYYKDDSYKYVKFLRMHRQHYVFVKLKKRELIDYDGQVYDIETRGSFKTPCGIVHNSEMSKWPPRKEDQLFADISQTVPEGGYITIESTPKGRTGKFFQLYEAAKEGDINYKCFFFPWWWDVTCVADPTIYNTTEKAVSASKALNMSLEGYLKEEKLLVEKANLSPQQIAFRRLKIAELKALFYQEYPENDTDCWLTSEIGVFDGVFIRQYLQQTQPGRHEGNLTVWKDVIGGERYVIGADPAGGLERGDFSVGSVLRVRTNEYVARIRGKIPPDLFAQELINLGKRYNLAELGVEKIMHGHTVLKVLMDANYPNIYHHQDYDMVTGGVKDEPGWITSSKTKPLMIDALQSALRSNDIMIWSENLLLEASGYIWEGQKAHASQGGYDDELIALMIALQIREQLPISEFKRSQAVSYIRL